MTVTFDYLLNKSLLHDHPVNGVSSDPASGLDGQLIINTTDNQLKVWYGGTWQVIATLEGAKIRISMGQPIGLMGVTYADDVI